VAAPAATPNVPIFKAPVSQGIDGHRNTVNTNRVIGIDPQNRPGLTEPVGRR